MTSAQTLSYHAGALIVVQGMHDHPHLVYFLLLRTQVCVLLSQKIHVCTQLIDAFLEPFVFCYQLILDLHIRAVTAL